MVGAAPVLSASLTLGIAVWRQRVVMLERSGQSWAVAGAFPAPMQLITWNYWSKIVEIFSVV